MGKQATEMRKDLRALAARLDALEAPAAGGTADAA